MPSPQRGEGFPAVRSLATDTLKPRSRFTSGDYPLHDYAPSRNGQPLLRPYTRDRSGDERAAWAWQQVADIQARLRGEPPPGPVAIPPASKQPCPTCGHTIRCWCPEPAPGQEPEPESPPDWCGTCGYLLTWCACPGGPRGGGR